MRVSEIKTLGSFYLVIYWTIEKYTYITFYIVSMTYYTSHTSLKSKTLEVHGHLEKMSVGRACSHLITACETSFLNLKDLPQSTSFSWPSNGKRKRSGEYSGCDIHKSWTVAYVAQALWGQAVSCCNITPCLLYTSRCV